MKFLSDENKGALYCIISGLLYGLLGYFGIHIMHAGISVYNMLFWRFLVASIFIAIVILPKIRTLNIDFSKLIICLISGSVLHGVGSGIYFIASSYIGTGLAMVIFFTYPMIVILGNWLIYNQKITAIYYFSVIIILIGMTLLIDVHEATLDLYGIVLSLISAAFYAVYVIVSKNQINGLPPLVSTLMVCTGSLISCFFIALFNNSFTIITSYNIWVDVICLAIISTALPILFLLEGLKYISSRKASILSVLEPVGVFIVGVSILGEQVSLYKVLGVIIILTSALVVQFDKIKA